MTFEEITKDLENAEAIPILKGWLDRGDGIALYENCDLGSMNLSHKQWVSFGSDKARIQGEAPVRMPDIGSKINWAYTLVGTCKNT